MRAGGREINDSQATVAQADAAVGREPIAVAIGPTRGHRIANGRQLGRVDGFAGAVIKDGSDAAHGGTTGRQDYGPQDYKDYETKGLNDSTSRKTSEPENNNTGNGCGDFRELTGFFFDCPDQAMEAAEGLFCLRVQFVRFIGRQVSQPS